MKKLLVAIPLVLSVGCVQPDESNIESEIGALLDLYVQSVNEADYVLLREIWIESDDISYVNPLDRLQSSEELEGFWRIFLEDGFSARDLRPSDVSIHAAGSEAAWAVYDWDFDATTSDGEPFSTTGWETQFYRLTDSGWRIEHIHYSTVPAQTPSDSGS